MKKEAGPKKKEKKGRLVIDQDSICGKVFFSFPPGEMGLGYFLIWVGLSVGRSTTGYERKD